MFVPKTDYFYIKTMDDSIVLISDNSQDRNSNATATVPTANGNNFSDIDDDDGDFMVPLPDWDDPEDEDYTAPVFTKVRKSPKDIRGPKATAKNKEKAAAAEARARAKESKLALQQERKALAEKKKAERLEQRLAKEAEKLLKKQHRLTTRARQPKSLVKSVMIQVDERILELGNVNVFEYEARKNLLDPKEPVSLEFVDADIPYSICWNLPEPEDDTEPIISSCEVVVILPAVLFVNLVHGSLIKDDRSNLLAYFRSLKQKTPDKILLIIFGLQGYLQNYKTLQNRQHRQQCGDPVADANLTKGLKSFDGLKSIISPDDIDHALVELQMILNIPHMTAADLAELAVLVQHFTKALVEKPQKTRKRVAEMANTWQEIGASRKKLGEDGSGLKELWKRVITQAFYNQDTAFADAVIRKYGSLRELLEAYRQCDSVVMAKSLLSQADVGGRRRLENSRRIHMALTCRDPDAVINRDK